MTNISKDLRATLSNLFYIWRPEILTSNKSEDGTIKWLLKLVSLYSYSHKNFCIHMVEFMCQAFWNSCAALVRLAAALLYRLPK